MMSEKDYPYTAWDGDCVYNAAKLTPVKPFSHTQVTPNSAAALKQAIAAGPVLVAVEADSF